MKKNLLQVKVLLDALPYIKKYSGQIFVIKYGGSAQIDSVLKDKVAQDILLMYFMGIKPVIIHGGGNKISSLLSKLDIKSKFIDGLRVTDEATMEVVEMVLSGNINKEITALINQHGAKALGISGKDANFITATPINMQKYGLVGKITNVDKNVIHKLLDENFIPIIAPIAASEKDEKYSGYNINADFAASKIAQSIGAKKVIFMTNIPGVMGRDKNFFSTLKAQEIDILKKEGTISGGMIPKVDACLDAIKGGVPKAHIIDGRVEHALLLEIFTSNGVGTVIKNN